MLLFSTFNGAQRHSAIQSHKSAVMLDRQAEQIQVCQLPVAVDFAVVKGGGIEKAQVVGPELMMWGLAKGL